MGRNTARPYLKALDAAGLLDGPVDDLPDLEDLKAAVAAQVPAKPAPQQVSSVVEWGPTIEGMASHGAGPRAIYDALRLEEGVFEGSYSAVKRYWRRLHRNKPPAPEDVAIPVTTAPANAPLRQTASRTRRP